jgi:hypothetical protein
MGKKPLEMAFLSWEAFEKAGCFFRILSKT